MEYLSATRKDKNLQECCSLNGIGGSHAKQSESEGIKQILHVLAHRLSIKNKKERIRESPKETTL